MTVTKVHIINSVSNHPGLLKTRFAQVVESLLDIIKKTLEKGEDVLISGFGKFCVKEKGDGEGKIPGLGVT